MEGHIMEDEQLKRKFGAPPKLLPPCCVCGAPGTGLHYGVTTCEPCKGFYRRCLVRGKPPRCRKNGAVACEIKYGVKNPCAGCRYVKCNQAGMSKDAIKLGRYNLAKKTKDILAYKHAKGSNDAPDSFIDQRYEEFSSSGASEEPSPQSTVPSPVVQDMPPSPSSIVPSPVTSVQSPAQVEVKKEEGGFIAAVTKAMRETIGAWRKLPGVYDRESLPSMQGLRTDIDAVEFMEILKETGIPPDPRLELFEKWAKRMCVFATRAVKFMKRVPGFRELHEDDQAAMLKDVLIDFDHIIHRGLLDIDTKMTVFYDGDTICSLPLSVITSKHMEPLIVRTQQKVLELNLTEEEECALLLVSAFSSDRATYKDFQKIDSLQKYYIRSLQQLLQKRYGSNSGTLFAQMCSVLVQLRSCSFYSDKVMQKLITPLKKTSDFPPLTMEIFQNRVSDLPV